MSDNTDSVVHDESLNQVRSLQRQRFTFFSVKRTRGRFAAIAEAVLAGAIVLSGIILLAVTIALNVLFSSLGQAYLSAGYLSLRIVLAVAMIAIGCYYIVGLLWKVGVSRERREALVNRAGEIDLLNEFRRRRDDLPTVPVEPPLPGTRFSFRLTSSRGNLWRLITLALMSVMLVVIASILIPTAFAEAKQATLGAIAIIFSPLICGAAVWFVYRFFKQLLKLTGIGPTIIELSDYPLHPGDKCQVRLFQPGRIRLKVITAWLVCQEEATFNQGTDIRTETHDVFRTRMFRKRSVNVSPERPFDTEFEMSIPIDAMHSFVSANNKIRWKIIVQAEAKGWPRLNRTFRLSVYPRNVTAPKLSVVPNRP